MRSLESARIERETLLASMDWPAEPQEMCLQCGIKQRNAFSWFCRIECEDAYIEERKC